MSTTVIPHRRERAGYRFTDVARMEWIKLRTLALHGLDHAAFWPRACWAWPSWS